MTGLIAIGKSGKHLIGQLHRILKVTWPLLIT